MIEPPAKEPPQSGAPPLSPALGPDDGLRNLTESIASKYALGVEPARNRPGRPRGKGTGHAHGKLPRDAQGNIIRPGQVEAQGAPVSGPPIGAPAPPPIDTALIEECVKALLETIDSTIKQSVRESAFELTESAPMADNLSGKVAMKETEKSAMSKLSAVCCQQYQLAGQHAPAVFLGVFVVGYTARVAFVIRALKAMLHVKERQERNKREFGPPPK